MAKERACIFCGKVYEYCPHCNNNSEPTWKFNFDSEKCHDLYDAVAGYNMGVKTIDDVKATLDKYEVTDYSIFSERIQNKLNELVPQNKEEVAVESRSDEVVKPNYNNKFKKNFNKKHDTEKKVDAEE